MPVPPKEAIRDFCEAVAKILEEHEYQIDKRLDLEAGICSIDYHRPNIAKKVEDILKEHGERDIEYMVKWSTSGYISLAHNEILDVLMMTGEIPFPLIPDEFKRCEIFVNEPPYKFTRITEVYPQVHRGHGTVRIHFEADIKRDKPAIEQLIREVERLISDAVDCEFLLSLLE